MLNMNLAIALLSISGCCVYVYAMSALGRLLAACRESCSVAAIAPAPTFTLRA
jgi:hypothetical protein